MLGTIVVLKYPYFRDISEPDIYETPTVHTVVGPSDSHDAEIHNPIAVSYMTSCVLHFCVYTIYGV